MKDFGFNGVEREFTVVTFVSAFADVMDLNAVFVFFNDKDTDCDVREFRNTEHHCLFVRNFKLHSTNSNNMFSFVNYGRVLRTFVNNYSNRFVDL